MVGLLSAWAGAYGLPDPLVQAAEITAADVTMPADVGVALRSMDAIGRGAAETMRWAHGHIASAWSAPQPATALSFTGQVAEAIAADCSAFAAAAEAVAQIITEVHGDVAATLAAAEQRITAEGLQYWYVDLAMMEQVVRGRYALVTEVNARLGALARHVDSAVTAAAAQVQRDPRRHLPADMTPRPSRAAAELNRAHRVDLARDLAAGSLADRVTAATVGTTLAQIEAAGFTSQLWEYSARNPTGQGAAAIAIGDVATADTVAVIVPGIGNAPTQMGDTAKLAIDLQRAAAEAGADGSRHATVIWFGYDIPASWPKEVVAGGPVQMLVHAWNDSVSATNAARAAVAGPELGDFARQLRQSMGPAATLTLIGHSYGSTVVSQAARDLGPEAGIDDIVLLASPGAGYQVPSAAGYRAVSADHVYSLAFPADPVAQPVTDIAARAVNPLGAFGADPNAPDFGAQRIAVPSNIPVTEGLNLAQHGLDNYLSGPALTAVAGIVAGNYGRVPTRRKEK